MSVPSVHVVVVAYHAADQLERCLAGLGRQVPVTVIDNSSSFQVSHVAMRHGARYIDSGANLGFAAGVNVALRRLADDAADILLVNPDAVVTPDTVRALEAFLHQPANGRVGAVSPRLVGPGGEEQRVQWPFPTPARMWAEALGLGHLPMRAGFVIGAVLLIAREALDEVGLFDERFFLYAEETDWQRRARARGWEAAVCGDASAHHEGAGTSENPLRREMLFQAAQETYIRKWYGAAGWLRYRTAACLGAAIRSVVFTGERRRRAAVRASLYLLGPRRCASRAVE